MRIRTVWNWRLRLYPIVVIPLMVYFVAERQVPVDYSVRQNAAVNEPVVSAAPCCVCFEGEIVQRFCWRLTEERR